MSYRVEWNTETKTYQFMRGKEVLAERKEGSNIYAFAFGWVCSELERLKGQQNESIRQE